MRGVCVARLRTHHQSHAARPSALSRKPYVATNLNQAVATMTHWPACLPIAPADSIYAPVCPGGWRVGAAGPPARAASSPLWPLPRATCPTCVAAQGPPHTGHSMHASGEEAAPTHSRQGADTCAPPPARHCAASLSERARDASSGSPAHTCAKGGHVRLCRQHRLRAKRGPLMGSSSRCRIDTQRISIYSSPRNPHQSKCRGGVVI